MARKFRHDLVKHTQTLEALMEEQEESGLREYAENLKQEYQKVENRNECESEVVNTIRSMKRQQCQEKQNPLVIYIEEKEYALVRDIDLVGIRMNLLNNAIEENEKIELTGRRGIWINMKEKDHGAVWLQVRNHIRHTEKKKQEEYGIGREILERNLLDQKGANCDSHAIFCVKIWKCYWEKEKDFGI